MSGPTPLILRARRVRASDNRKLCLNWDFFVSSGTMMWVCRCTVTILAANSAQLDSEISSPLIFWQKCPQSTANDFSVLCNPPSWFAPHVCENIWKSRWLFPCFEACRLQIMSDLALLSIYIGPDSRCLLKRWAVATEWSVLYSYIQNQSPRKCRRSSRPDLVSTKRFSLTSVQLPWWGILCLQWLLIKFSCTLQRLLGVKGLNCHHIHLMPWILSKMKAHSRISGHHACIFQRF